MFLIFLVNCFEIVSTKILGTLYTFSNIIKYFCSTNQSFFLMDLFTRVGIDRIIGNGFRLEEGKFTLDIGKYSSL